MTIRKTQAAPLSTRLPTTPIRKLRAKRLVAALKRLNTPPKKRTRT